MGQEKTISITAPERIASDIGFAESPLWHKDGYLIFSDVSNNRIMKLIDGRTEVFLENSGWEGPPLEEQSDQRGANGITYDHEGNLILCQHGKHAVAVIKNNVVETIADSFHNVRLNSPNDVCVGRDGSIYFTDPPYGLKEKKLRPDIAQPISGVYRIFDHMLQLLTTEFKYPNGICFSPDYKYLYVSSTQQIDASVRRYEVIGGRLYNGVTFVEEQADGIKTDLQGNLYLATPKGVKIFSSSAELIDFIPLPENVTNLCIHSAELYITTATSVYKSLITMS